MMKRCFTSYIRLAICVAFVYASGGRPVSGSSLSAYDEAPLIITNRAFIPDRTVTLCGKSFAGDKRGFSPQSSASARATIVVALHVWSVQSGSLLLSVAKEFGETKQVDSRDVVLRSKRAQSGISNPELRRLPEGNVLMGLRICARNPLMPALLTPPIYEDIKILIGRSGLITISGRVSKYPSFELNVSRGRGGTPLNVPLSGTQIGESPLNLLRKKEIFVVKFLPFLPPPAFSTVIQGQQKAQKTSTTAVAPRLQ
jgi:hypothetical protein